MSGKVTEQFRALGHEAYSCDLIPSIKNGKWHYTGDVRPLLGFSWDLIIGFPPCTYFCSSGVRWLKDNKPRKRLQVESLKFVWEIYNGISPRVCIENPIGMLSSLFRKPDQMIHPWQFGHGEKKSTCLWLRGLPHLVPTRIVGGREARIHRMPPSKYRAMLRSITYDGIAKAMAEQWGK